MKMKNIKKIAYILVELPQLWPCLEPRRTIAHRVFANAAPQPLFEITGGLLISSNSIPRASPSRASVARCSAGLFCLSRERFVENAKNAVPNKAYGKIFDFHPSTINSDIEAPPTIKMV